MNSEQYLGDLDREIARPGSINVKDILRKYVYHWPVFLLGLILTMSIAYLYLRYTKPVYQINSVILIKDDKKGASPEDMLSQLDLFSSSKVVENELEILKSKTLMRAVVKRLHLNVVSIVEGRVVSSILYEKKPVNFVTFEMNPEIYGHELTITSQDAIHFKLQDLTTGKLVDGRFNQLQRNGFGVFEISPTRYFGKSKNFSMKFIVKDPLLVADDCLARLAVVVAGKLSTVINLSFQTTIPQEGKDVLNTLIQVYNEASLADKNETTQSTIRFIDERLGLISGELSDVERDVESFKTSNGLTDISSEAGLYLENVKANDALLNEVNIKLSAIDDIKRFVNSNSTTGKLPSTFGIDDPVLLGQITLLGELQLQKEQLLSTTQETNPLVQPLTKKIETVRSGIIANIQSITSTLLGTKKELQANNSKYQGSIRKIPTQERQFISIKRQQSIKESLYLYLLQKREEAALSYASTVADSRVVDVAYSSNSPIKPKAALTYMVALFLGLILPVGYVYGKELMNNKVVKLEDITSRTQAPVLGEVLYEEDSPNIVVNSNSRSAVAEQFRSIRTNLQYIHGKQEAGLGKVTLFTSSMSGEGKSFVASNLAVALAISGRKTVLLELDLRKPKISKYLNLNNNTGFSHYLIGKAGHQDIIQPSGIHENLLVIGSGPIPPNPSELLLENSVEALIAFLRINFDEIIIDTPPIGLVTDAQILSRIADASVYIVRHGYTEIEQLNQVAQLYDKGIFPKLNIILNGIQLQGSYGYGYSGYGYGYGYGYYSSDKPTEKKMSFEFLKSLFKRF